MSSGSGADIKVNSRGAVAADFDNDGDLDIIANTISGPIWFYQNNDIRNNAIFFELRDGFLMHNRCHVLISVTCLQR